jgi:hypothetical protein
MLAMGQVKEMIIFSSINHFLSSFMLEIFFI